MPKKRGRPRQGEAIRIVKSVRVDPLFLEKLTRKSKETFQHWVDERVHKWELEVDRPKKKKAS